MMGADLYVKGLPPHICGGEVSQKAAKAGYFRDCYNDGGLFANIGLSWWQMVSQFKKEGKLDDDGNLKPHFVSDFSKIVEDAFKASKVSKKKEYIEWMEVFRTFIKTAEKVGEGIEFSV